MGWFDKDEEHGLQGYGEKEDGRGTWWDSDQYGSGRESTDKAEDGTVTHYRHETNDSPAEGWTYNPDTGESTKFGPGNK